MAGKQPEADQPVDRKPRLEKLAQKRSHTIGDTPPRSRRLTGAIKSATTIYGLRWNDPARAKRRHVSRLARYAGGFWRIWDHRRRVCDGDRREVADLPEPPDYPARFAAAADSEVHCPDPAASERIQAAIRQVRSTRIRWAV